MNRFDAIMKNAVNSVLHDVDTITTCAQDFYTGTLIPNLEERAKGINLAPYTVSRSELTDIMLRAQLNFNKANAVDGCMNVVVMNILMQEIAALLVNDGFYVFWDDQADIGKGKDLVIEFIPSEEYSHALLTDEIVAKYRDDFFATWQDA